MIAETRREEANRQDAESAKAGKLIFSATLRDLRALRGETDQLLVAARTADPRSSGDAAT